MKKHKNTNSVGDIIRQHVKSIGKEDEYLEAIVKNHWEEIAGKVVFDHTKDINYYNKVLYVKIESPILKNELNYLKDKFIEKINNYVKKTFVTGIVFN